MMRTTTFVVVALAFAGTNARADFSYTQTRKTTGGMMANMAPAIPPSKMYFKGQKMKSETGDSAVILDFDAQTITTISNAAKTYTVKSFHDAVEPAGQANAQIDVKETDQKKTIDGFDCRELLMTMTSEVQAGRAGAMQVQMEIDNWISSDVPGVRELRAFYQKNADHFPWAAIAAGANPQLQQAIADVQRKMASMDGVPVQQILRVKPAGGAGAPAMPQMPQMSVAQSAQMAQARARLEALAQHGGPAAAAAQQALSRMGSMPGGGGSAPAGGGTPGVLMEITMESHDFSSAAIPDSVFGIPAGYQQK